MKAPKTIAADVAQVQQAMRGERALRCHGRDQRGPAPRGAGVHGSEERHDPLQHREHEGEQPSGHEQHAEQHRQALRHELERERAAQREAGGEAAPGHAHQQESRAERRPQPRPQRTLHHDDMQAGRRQAEPAGERQQRAVATQRDRDQRESDRKGCGRERRRGQAAGGRRRQREHRQHEARQAERQQPHETVACEHQVREREGGAIERDAVLVMRNERHAEQQRRDQAGECRPAVGANGRHAARVSQVGEEQPAIDGERGEDRDRAERHEARLEGGSAAREDEHARGEQPPDAFRSRHRAHRLARGNGQHLQAGADRRHDEHSERHAMQRREQRPEAAAKIGQRIRAGEQQPPGEHLEGGRGAR